MNIYDFLSNECKTKYIKVGAADGSAFFYCGTKELFLLNLTVYQAELKRAALYRRNAFKKAFEALVNNPPSLSKYILSECVYDKPKPSYDAYIASVKAWMRSCVDAKAVATAAKEYYDNYKDLMQRDIVEHSISSVDEDTTRIIIPGNELGVYWMMEESWGKMPFALRSKTEDDDD